VVVRWSLWLARRSALHPSTLDRSATPLHPVYQPYKVYARDFSSFCKANGLSEKDMLKVAHGEVDSSKGWRQGQFPGSLGTPRAKVIERSRPGPPVFAGPFWGALPGKEHQYEAPAAPVFLPVKVYTPAD
jgi:hypothetical protein